MNLINWNLVQDLKTLFIEQILLEHLDKKIFTIFSKLRWNKALKWCILAKLDRIQHYLW